MPVTPVFDVDLRAVLDAADGRRRRSRQKLPGASDLGVCRRRMGYKMTGQKVDNPASKAKAIQGTLLHRGALAALKAAHGGLTEVRVEVPGVLRGALDWLRSDPLGLWIVDDLKTTGKDNHERAVRGPVSLPHLWQTMTYASLCRAGRICDRRLPADPIEVVDIEILYLCRDDGRTDSRRVPYDQDTADEAWAWLEEVTERVATDGVQRVPRDLPGPEVSPICRGCPFARDCWKWDPATGEREPLELGDPELEQWAHDYHAAQRAESKAGDDKKLARAHLHGQPAQKWTSGWQLGWNGGGEKWVDEPDFEAIEAEYAAAGLQVPTRRVNRGKSAAISVLPPRPKK